MASIYVECLPADGEVRSDCALWHWRSGSRFVDATGTGCDSEQVQAIVVWKFGAVLELRMGNVELRLRE